MIPTTRLEMVVSKPMKQKALAEPRKYDIFHPSDWGYCLRKVALLWYNEHEKFLKKGEQHIDLKGQRVYDNGHGMHARWRDYLDAANVLRGVWKCPRCEVLCGDKEPLGILNPSNKEGWSCEKCKTTRKMQYEELLVRSDPRYNFEGHVDAVVDLRGTQFSTKPELDLMVVDFKSIKDDYFDDIIEHAKPEHVVQVTIYMWLLDLRSAMLIYENKNTQEVKEILVLRDEKKVDEIKKQAEWLVEVLRHRRLPSRPNGYSRSGFPCRFCDFVDSCYA